MLIRNYEAHDCPNLVKLFQNTVHTINAKDYTKEQLAVWTTENVNIEEWNRSFLEHNTLVAVINDEIVGFADMSKTGYLDRLYVHKDFQGIGIATALVKMLEQDLKKDNVSCFETYASITAKPFFESQGYIVEERNIVVRNGISLVNYKMTKKILNF